MLKVLGWISVIAVVIAAGVYVAFQVSPWPSALLVRYAFDVDGERTARALEKYLPSNVSETLNEQYAPNDPDARLDVFHPSSLENGGPAPLTVVWVHGGGWVSGSKEQIGNYTRILAGNGFTVVSVGYSIAPGAVYPRPVHQVNAALAYVVANAERLHVNPSRLVLAGDSAGSQIASQLANVVSSPSYAEAVGMAPAISRSQLVGMLLYCGAYTMDGVDLDGPFSGFLRTVLWSYSGTKDFLASKAFASAWVVQHVTPDFPPTFISAGNADPLLSQSLVMADALEKNGVRVDRLFFPKDYTPSLPHEYQFKLDTEAAKLALDRSVTFLQSLP
jgi:acetyl esterase/lipase